MSSLWASSRVASSTANDLTTLDGRIVDVAVVGAGITGLTAAVLLARAGKSVTVVEARNAGAGATGNTTGKLSVLQGTKLARVRSAHDSGTLRAYVEANTEGREWLLRHCADRGLVVQRQDDHAYAQDADGLEAARAVLDACADAGLEDARWVDHADVPFPFYGGVLLPDQAQIDPMPVLDSLVTELHSHGGSLFHGVRAVGVGDSGPMTTLRLQSTHTNGQEHQEFSMSARHVVLATGIPFLDRGGFFARVSAHRSYCLAFEVPGEVTRPTFISVDSPTRSIRWAPHPEGEKLIVGGAGHRVGHGQQASRTVTELAEWATTHYPGAQQTHFWSAQDYSPVDELPYVGPLLPFGEKVLIATGFDKWGLTNGVAAALALSSRILGGQITWAGALSSWSTHELKGLPRAAKANATVGVDMATGWLAPMACSSTHLTDGYGVVSGAPWHLRADSVVDDTYRTVSPVCPHLGGIVSWNDADQSWECPLHGSRFAPDGTVLEGPAVRGLSPTTHGTVAAGLLWTP
ncbi:MAG: FAD-dependent oxidoreductase [Mycobacterium sp.]|mgnify:CR=1 FL=1